MSLEDAISKLAHEIALNTAAVKENTLVRNGGKPVLTVQVPAEEAVSVGAAGFFPEQDAATKTEEVIQKAKKPTPAKMEETVSSGNGVSPQLEPETAADEISVVLDYQKDVMPVLSKFFVKCGKAKAEALMAKWNVTKFSQIPGEKLGALMVDLNSGLGAV